MLTTNRVYQMNICVNFNKPRKKESSLLTSSLPFTFPGVGGRRAASSAGWIVFHYKKPQRGTAGKLAAGPLPRISSKWRRRGGATSIQYCSEHRRNRSDPKRPPRRPKSTPRQSPKGTAQQRPHRAPRGPQEASQRPPRGLPDAPARTQEARKRPPRGPQEIPQGPTTTGLYVLRTCTPRSERNPRPEVTC